MSMQVPPMNLRLWRQIEILLAIVLSLTCGTLMVSCKSMFEIGNDRMVKSLYVAFFPKDVYTNEPGRGYEVIFDAYIVNMGSLAICLDRRPFAKSLELGSGPNVGEIPTGPQFLTEPEFRLLEPLGKDMSDLIACGKGGVADATTHSNIMNRLPHSKYLPLKLRLDVTGEDAAMKSLWATWRLRFDMFRSDKIVVIDVYSSVDVKAAVAEYFSRVPVEKRQRM